jgi:hypothetical protein
MTIGNLRSPFRRAAPVAAVLLLPLSMLGQSAAAGPTVAKLVSICDSGFAQGNTGLDAAMCEWYAAPCACHARLVGQGAPTWCVPDTETIDLTVRKVVARLRRYPDPTADASAVVTKMLAQIYPCRSSDAEPPADSGARRSGR